MTSVSTGQYLIEVRGTMMTARGRRHAVGRASAKRVGGVKTAELPSTPSSVPVVRHLVQDDLAGRQLPRRLVEDALVVVSELMGNAVRHARPLDTGNSAGCVRVEWSASSEEVRIGVTDGGGLDKPHVEETSPSDSSGRGLTIVDAVAQEWGVTSADGEVTVYAVVST